ncbi:hypothetical protein [Campylobacter sputorum]|uniref:hypothetical protein n=1 Tax=Campylobacter sputorum TaxID=206 RepID=UPI001E3B9CBC|nr:hypothetical protein [Campylobacter sputorum]
MLKKQNTNKHIITIDVAENTAFNFKENRASMHDLLQPPEKNDFYISYLPYNEAKANTIIEIPSSTPEEDIANTITIKAYEEQNLDPNEEYKISYIEVLNTNSQDVRIFNIFVIENSKLNTIFSKIVDKKKYIDYIAYAPLLVKSLYTKNILPSSSCDCFIVMMKNEAFLTIYNNAEYIHSRSFRYSLRYLSEKYAELNASRINEESFFQTLMQDGLNNSDENLHQIFEDMIYYISDLTKNISRMQNISINNIYIYTDIGNIPKFNELVENITEIKTNGFSFDITINSKTLKLNIFHNLMFLTAQDYIEHKDDEFNFSTFLRPPPLFQRDSGKLILTILVAILLSTGVPVYNYISAFVLNLQTKYMKEELLIKDAKKRQIEIQLAAIAKEQDDVDKIIQAENEKLEFRKKLLNELYNKKENYPMKSIALHNLSILINKYNTKVYQIKNTDNNLTVTIRSDSDTKLTELIKEISKTKSYSVSTKQIALDENDTRTYESNVTIRINQ